jgi:hypothetical protein
MTVRFIAALLTLIGLAQGAALADSAPQPQRHLVYAFTYGSSSDLETHTSGFGAAAVGTMSVNNMSGNGATHDTNGVQDRGTVTVDVFAERPDGALVVTVSEQADTSRSANPAACVVYDNTAVLCDPGKKVNDEELAILRLLGPHFVNASQLDDKQHWKTTLSGKGATQSSDFTILKNDDGLMSISEAATASQTTMPKIDSTTNATIGYNSHLQVPTSLTTYTIARQQQTMETHLTQKTQVTATLTSDSLATKN